MASFKVGDAVQLTREGRRIYTWLPTYPGIVVSVFYSNGVKIMWPFWENQSGDNFHSMSPDYVFLVEERSND